MKLILPLPISDNRRLIFAPRLRRFVSSKEFREYKRSVQVVALMQARKCGLREPISPTFELQHVVKIKFYLKDKKRDASDMIKCLLDVLTGVIFSDDKWLVIQMEYPICINKENPCVEVTL